MEHIKRKLNQIFVILKCKFCKRKCAFLLKPCGHGTCDDCDSLKCKTCNKVNESTEFWMFKSLWILNNEISKVVDSIENSNRVRESLYADMSLSCENDLYLSQATPFTKSPLINELSPFNDGNSVLSKYELKQLKEDEIHITQSGLTQINDESENNYPLKEKVGEDNVNSVFSSWCMELTPSDNKLETTKNNNKIFITEKEIINEEIKDVTYKDECSNHEIFTLSNYDTSEDSRQSQNIQVKIKLKREESDENSESENNRIHKRKQNLLEENQEDTNVQNYSYESAIENSSKEEYISPDESLNKNKKSKYHLKKPIVFLTSSLTKDQLELLNKTHSKIKRKIEIQEEFDDNVTHLLVNTDSSNLCARTKKYLLCLISGKYILSFDFYNALLKNSSVSENKYFVGGDTASNATNTPSKMYKLMKSKKGFFKDINFLIKENFVTKELIQIVKVGGGYINKDRPGMKIEHPKIIYDYISHCVYLPNH